MTYVYKVNNATDLVGTNKQRTNASSVSWSAAVQNPHKPQHCLATGVFLCTFFSFSIYRHSHIRWLAIPRHWQPVQSTARVRNRQINDEELIADGRTTIAPSVSFSIFSGLLPDVIVSAAGPLGPAMGVRPSGFVQLLLRVSLRQHTQHDIVIQLLSVCLSVQCRYCVETTAHIVKVRPSPEVAHFCVRNLIVVDLLFVFFDVEAVDFF